MWGLYYGDDYIKKIVIEIMGMFSDENVEEEFRNFLLKTTEKDEIKNDIFMHLKRMGARGTVYCLHQRVQLLRCGSAACPKISAKWPNHTQMRLGVFVKNTRNLYSSEIMTTGVELLATIAKLRSDDGEWITQPAGICCCAWRCVSVRYRMLLRRRHSENLTKRYEITHKALEHYYHIIYEYLEEGDDYAD